MGTMRVRPQDLTTAKIMFNNPTITVASLYLATHSVPVTLFATTGAALLTGWLAWLPCKPPGSGTGKTRDGLQADDTAQPGASSSALEPSPVQSAEANCGHEPPTTTASDQEHSLSTEK